MSEPPPVEDPADEGGGEHKKKRKKHKKHRSKEGDGADAEGEPANGNSAAEAAKASRSYSPSPVRKKKPAAPADNKPARFWDGFQWVDVEKNEADSAPLMGQATRKDRRLYVGNLPIGAGLADKQLSEFCSVS
ncbi:hypothetical protein EMIHUDRAFT_458691 [Emiliania huxleyi CCMP1516]|uniref:RRM domain-containing protein n=2 Tax=Emiliania huxleyi TaxID=2903 RepID=A0A0D3J884_EMIH1|nr:hypothetical protein EMIHUDRAFT_458691 [Emiliania huxleyi CCMP1516]EOD19719.1 hypothetical protein EMIHUDRAFT_458691 [Emiliania huxleyi CCMP1516]|eukprot:XP_005772148.1 hypothetical protein EMIHUDRAFT_458691 [Emiliania huxleyi CCMP1516]